MQNNSNEIEAKIAQIETQMGRIGFWDDKIKAQEAVKRLGELKEGLLGAEKYDKGGAILSIISGAGGDDAEDFSAMLLRMYLKYIEKKGWSYHLLHKNKNDHNGYRNISIEIISPPAKGECPKGKGVYGTLRNESGVHRLVRISPFNAKAKRHTSFSLVEVVPKIEKGDRAIEISPDEIKIEFSKSSGPGGQNVNKRETAVRLVHFPTNISVHVSSERSQEQNREKAMELLRGKLFKKHEEDEKKIKAGLSASKTTEIEWGSQIRSYVLHPYHQVKDHRTGIEISNTEAILENGELDVFIEAEKDLC